MQLTDALLDLCKQSSHPIIAIDGPAGAGKTTLAEHLRAALSLRYKVGVLHMDNFYNGWDAPFDEHLSRALTLACRSHQTGAKFSLPQFNWSKNSFGEPVEFQPQELLILEGVGSSQIAIRPFLTSSIWIAIDPLQGVERVLARDGESISTEMTRWISQQEQHFRENDSQKAADFVLTN